MEEKTDPKEFIAEASTKLDSWIESQKFDGWDPFDALRSPLLRFLTFNNRRIGQGWVQLLKHSPVNLRTLLRVKKGYNPKGMGLFLSSYLRKYLRSGNQEYLENIIFFAKWLEDNITPGYSGACWGYNFDWPNRGFFAPAGTPTIVNTAFIGLAFLDLYRAFGSGSSIHTENKLTNPLLIARSACEFILKDLNIDRIGTSKLCFSYTPLDHRYVHNANMMGAWLLAEVYRETGEPILRDFAITASRYTVSNQLSDGSWWYGEAHMDHWIDNFHTGFLLVALKRIISNLSIDDFDNQLSNGYAFWKKYMFQPDGTPKYHPQKTYTIDIHSIAQGILTFLDFQDRDTEANCWAERVAMWGIKNMQDSSGYFYYQINPRYRNRIPYMRWSQAWMQRAITNMVD